MPRDLARPRSEGSVDSDQMFQARLVAKTASGTLVTEEGYALTSADVSTATCAVYYADGATPSTAVATPTVTVASAFITLVDDNWWNVDTTGCNFRHTVAGSAFANPGNYVVQYTITLTDATVRKFAFSHYAEAAGIE